MFQPLPAPPTLPMGAAPYRGGTTFRVWAPGAKRVTVLGGFNGWRVESGVGLERDQAGYWSGAVAGVGAGDQYKFWIDGRGGSGYKRDPYARELTSPDCDPGTLPYPLCNCVVRDRDDYPWHDAGYRPPAFNDLVIYQFHVGTFSGMDAQGGDTRQRRVARFLDVLFRLDHLVALGVNALQPLPIVEFPTEFSLGYNGVDLFSPEMAYAVPPEELGPYLAQLNALLARRDLPPVRGRALRAHSSQLKALVDICHVYGVAVVFDVVYNHAGGGFDDQSLYFFDRAPTGDNNDSQYFTDRGWAGGLSFALWKAEVRQFLIDNAQCFLGDFHGDGLRHDEVSALLSLNGTAGWEFCRDLTGTLAYAHADAIQISEHWPVSAALVTPVDQGGAGFDATWHDGLRDSVRRAVAQASGGSGARVDCTAIAQALAGNGLPSAWRAVQCLENHDLVYQAHDGSARVAGLADPSDPGSWYGRSRARVALGLLLTAPGIPMLFMGQEFLESRLWSDDARDAPDTLIRWERLGGGDRVATDFLHFARDLIGLRRGEPALRGESIHVHHVHDDNRVIAFHRWIEGAGEDVVVVATLAERPWNGYALGFPAAGRWREVFNSDVYDNWVNPAPVGNGGGVDAAWGGLHGLPASATVTIPANGFVVFRKA